MSDDTGEVIYLQLKRVDGDVKRVLTLTKNYGGCRHTRFTIDEKLAQVECRDCKQLLDPMYALRQLAHQETRFHDLHERYNDEMRRLGERSKTKCEHCRKMTRISRT